MSSRRLILLIVALIAIAFSWWGAIAPDKGLVVRSLERDNLPLLYLAPEQAQTVPGVLIAHGFAGSKRLMLGYARVLAHAGYAVMLWDFDGHGANPNPLQTRDLQPTLQVALAALLEQPAVDPTRLALLGHSMGSGVVMSAAVGEPNRFAATVAISPTGAGITPQVPRNLQFQAGSWEGGFINNAQRLLSLAGGENNNFAAGLARELIIVPGVEHITILFSDVSHQSALRWLDTTFNLTRQSSYRDRRMVWYALHLLGWLLVFPAIVPRLKQASIGIHPARRILGLLLAPFAATGTLVLLEQYVSLQALGGIQVGGAVAVWFLIAGLTWLGVMATIPRFTIKALIWSAIAFCILWVAFGAMAQFLWLQWWLIPIRFRLWLPLAIACFPWFLASGMVQQEISAVKRVAWWLGQSAILIGGFVLTLQVLPQLGFMYLLLPLFPPLMGILSFVAGWLNQAWAYAIASTLFFAWILAAGFPLSA